MGFEGIHGRFTLAVQLGNEAMSTGGDVARLLRELAAKIESADVLVALDGKHVYVRDANGNRVGEWTYTAAEPDDVNERSESDD